MSTKEIFHPHDVGLTWAHIRSHPLQERLSLERLDTARFSKGDKGSHKIRKMALVGASVAAGVALGILFHEPVSQIYFDFVNGMITQDNEIFRQTTNMYRHGGGIR